MSAALHGLLAEFESPGALLEAVRRVQADGFTRFTTFSPCPVPGLEKMVLAKPSPIPAIMLGAAVLGAAGGFGLQCYAASDYPIDVGGRPLFSWPAFVPVTFELGVLTAVLVGIGAFLWRAGLPRYHHPVFAVAAFTRASCDRFFLCVQADDPKFSPAKTHALLAALNPAHIWEVPA